MPLRAESPESEQIFRCQYEKSWDAVFIVARRIHSQSELKVDIAPYHLRPTFADCADYSDTGDILVTNVATGVVRRVEAKQRFFDFTDARDFPYRTLYVERPNHLEKNDPAYAYYMTNHAMTRAAVIMGDTRPQWLGPKKFWDRTYGFMATAYECPIELAKFVSLSPILREVA